MIPGLTHAQVNVVPQYSIGFKWMLEDEMIDDALGGIRRHLSSIESILKRARAKDEQNNNKRLPHTIKRGRTA